MTVLLIHLASTWFMTGLIWFVQVVHYPLFNQVGESVFSRYETIHTQSTTWVVGPVMLAELFSAGWLLWLAPEGIPGWKLWAGAGLLGIVWVSTALLQVPQHGLLASGFDQRAYETLVSTNWVRTVGWSLRGLLALWMLWDLLSPVEGG
ncbi:MAG: hypothetical protein ACO4AU_11190 [bacterium]